MNLNEMFTTEGLLILKEELGMRINDWHDLLKDCPGDETAKSRLSVLQKLYGSLDEQLSTTVTELIPEYVPGYDHTFIMKATYVNGECKTMECVGWYCGEPTDEYTKRFANHDMKANYDE